ncbi:hypothetical protein RhiirC2_858014 [Rhizophagus irregularis]|uniref:Uncharacterized protein n=1 Tax=Rhizophagus irregularis TaxID=588596 RepID=A0A2N1M8E3_9GLOM|nr:hypothetical protein RhiirC2_858014 [Rhizophagus irregularis]
MKELVHFFGDSVLKTRTHSQPGSTIIFTAVTDSVIFEEHLNLYEFEAFSSGYCLGSANWMIDCGGEKCHHHTSFAFNKTVFNNADVIILNDLRDKGGARFETILIEIGNCDESLQIKPINLPIDIRLTVNEITKMLRERKPPQHDCYDKKSSLNGTLNIHNTKTSLTLAENQLNQQRYVCGEFNVSKLINELTEQIYGYRIDEFEEDKRSSSYKISSISPKAMIYLNNENFKIITTE